MFEIKNDKVALKIYFIRLQKIQYNIIYIFTFQCQFNKLFLYEQTFFEDLCMICCMLKIA